MTQKINTCPKTQVVCLLLQCCGSADIFFVATISQVESSKAIVTVERVSQTERGTNHVNFFVLRLM